MDSTPQPGHSTLPANQPQPTLSRCISLTIDGEAPLTQAASGRTPQPGYDFAARAKAAADEIMAEKRLDFHDPRLATPGKPTESRTVLATPMSTPTPMTTPTPAPMCTKPPSSQVFIGPAPTPPPTPTPIPTLSAEDVAHGLCEAADAVDPFSPDPATVGGPDTGDFIDQAYAAQQTVPYGSAPPSFEVLVRAPIIIAEMLKKGPSTVVNFVCQQRDKSGPYYQLFPIDQKVQAAKDQWNNMDTKQKALFIGFTGLALLISIPLLIIIIK